MASLAELKQNRAAATRKAENLLQAAEQRGSAFTTQESVALSEATLEAEALSLQIESVERLNTLRSSNPHGVGVSLPGATRAAVGAPKSKPLSADYLHAFQAYLLSGGERQDAALYEGSNPQGGFAVPVTVSNEIVPLAPPETGIRRLATVLPTANDIKIPRQITGSVATAKAESGGTTNSFTETGPTIDQVTLSAFMAGAYVKLSYELLQDVPAFNAFAASDLQIAQQQLEESWFVSGTGVNQGQGFLGNIGQGVTAEPDALGNLVTIDGTLDLIGSVQAEYLEGAAFLMNRLTSVLIRKAQRQANLFEPVWTRSNGQDFLHGFPVEYSAQMPVAARGATPIVFGNWKQGFVIGDRGGSNINVKLLDQPFALQGQVALLAFRRTDSRVRRPQALQQYTVAAS